MILLALAQHVTKRVYIASARPSLFIRIVPSTTLLPRGETLFHLPPINILELSKDFSSTTRKYSKTFRLQKCFSRKSPLSRKNSKTCQAINSSNQQQQSTAATSSSNQQQQLATAISNSNQQQQPATPINSSNQQQQSAAATSNSNQQQRTAAATSISNQHSSYQQHLHNQHRPLLVITTVPASS